MKKMFTSLHFGWLVHGSVLLSLYLNREFCKKTKPSSTKIGVNTRIISNKTEIHRIKSPTLHSFPQSQSFP